MQIFRYFWALTFFFAKKAATDYNPEDGRLQTDEKLEDGTTVLNPLDDQIDKRYPLQVIARGDQAKANCFGGGWCTWKYLTGALLVTL